MIVHLRRHVGRHLVCCFRNGGIIACKLIEEALWRFFSDHI
jgi:hypothetical protein